MCILRAAVLAVLLLWPASTGAIDLLEGTWHLEPLVVRGAEAPGGNCQFEEFGESYVTEGFVAFWARCHTGTKKLDWRLFSLRETKVSQIVGASGVLKTPDQRGIGVGPSHLGTQLHAGRRMLYFSSQEPDHVYGWDGERVVRVLCSGDILPIGGIEYRIKKAAVLDVNASGHALLYFDANKPEAEGWVIHDGERFTPLRKEGDALPGGSGLRIQNLSSGPFCLFTCVPPARLLPDESVIAVIQLSGTPSRKGLWRIWPDKSEGMFYEELVRTLVGQGARGMGPLILAEPGFLLMDVRKTVKTGELPMVLFHHGGTYGLAFGIAGMELGAFDGVADLIYDNAVLLEPGSPRALISVRALQRSMKGDYSFQFRSFPGLYFFDGKELKRIGWEEAMLGEKARAGGSIRYPLPRIPWAEALAGGGRYVLGVLESPWTHEDIPPARIALRRVERPVEGVLVELPKLNDRNRRFFVPKASADGALLPAPRFNVQGETVTLGDVLFWKGADSAVAALEKGYYLLRRDPGP
jgi:hypothetical protein